MEENFVGIEAQSKFPVKIEFSRWVLPQSRRAFECAAWLYNDPHIIRQMISITEDEWNACAEQNSKLELIQIRMGMAVSVLLDKWARRLTGREGG